MNERIEHLKKNLAIILPGIFVVGFTVGTGSVTTMSKAGADYGLSLLWIIIISAAISLAFYYLATKFAVVSRMPLLYALRMHWGALVTLPLLCLFGIGVLGSCAGVLSIMTKCSIVWFGTLGIALPKEAVALLYAGIVYLMFLAGRFSMFEKIMAVIVFVMIICFFLVVLISPPPLATLFKGLSFTIPKFTGAGQPTRGAFVVIGGMIGTTLAIPMVIARTSQALQKNWQMEDLGNAKKDIINAVVLIFIINILIMSAAAGSVFKNKATLNSIEEMILIFAKLGIFAPTIFLFGLLAAGFSSQLPNIMMFNWLKNNYLNSDETMSTARHRIISAGYSLLAYVIAIQDIRPVPLMIVSQVTGCLLLPVVAGFLAYAYNRRNIMKDYTAGTGLNVLFLIIMVFALFMSIKTALGLKQYIIVNVISG